jgi:putative glutamine amidotransferase
MAARCTRTSARSKAGARVHRDGQIYDNNFHELDIVPGTRLAALLAGPQASRKINSIHHQGIKDLAPGFAVEARCPDDGVIEAIRLGGNDRRPWVAAVQWHPEFHKPEQGVIDDAPIAQRLSGRPRCPRP